MEAIDGTDHAASHARGTPASLLTIIVDTNPYAWAHLSDTLPLSQVVANLLIFINAHLAINHANQVTVIASHTTCAKWLYPTPRSAQNGDYETLNGVPGSDKALPGKSQPGSATNADDANKYRPFQQVEEELLRNLTDLISTTKPSEIEGRSVTMIAGAVTMALAHIAKQVLLQSPSEASNILNTDAPRVDPGLSALSEEPNGSMRKGATLSSRILIVSVSGDLAAQYIPMMNSIFAAQRQRVPIDVLKLAGNTVFLQQACDSTGGIFVDPSMYLPPAVQQNQTNGNTLDSTKAGSRATTSGALQGLLLYLLQPLLPDSFARRALVPPADAAVDFRAACFCHRKIVDVGYVCSVCLSIFCEPLPDGACLTCGTTLVLPREAGLIPAVLPRTRKKKKKKLAGTLESEGTPGYASSTAGTPGPS